MVQRKNAPSFDCYADDLIAGTVDLTTAEFGAYVRLLCWQFSHGDIPNDPARLRRITGVDDPEDLLDMMRNLGVKFKRLSSGYLRNERMHKEREKSLRRRRSSVSNGRKGGRPKKLTDSVNKNLGVNSRVTQIKPKRKVEVGICNSTEGTKESRRKIPPSVEEVARYCESRKNGIDPQDFIDYYSARGWKFKTGQPMKDWQATVRTWEKRRKEDGGKRSEETRHGTL